MSGLTFKDDLHVMSKHGDGYVNFQAARQDVGSSVSYSAWLSGAEDSYIIMKRDRTDTSNITMKYFYATIEQQAFQAAWDDRTNKAYVEYNELFPSL
jgi:hypothetical protein